MNICVVGTGYVGLVGAAVFADWGHTVCGVDIDEGKITNIKKGVMPIYEDGLGDLVRQHMDLDGLSFTTDISEGMFGAEVVFICVGTPQSKTGAADLSAVWAVAEDIGRCLDPDMYTVVVVKSTVPVGSNEKVKELIGVSAPKSAKFSVVSNPEFLREGSAIWDMNNPDRTVLGIGSSDRLSEEVCRVLFSLYEHLSSPIVWYDLRTAEMIKYASNAFLAMKVTSINEIALMCERVGADVDRVAEGIGLDPRIGPDFLKAGIGYGGSCFPKDVQALMNTAKQTGSPLTIVSAVDAVNDHLPELFVEKVIREFGVNLSGIKIACLGLAFKANTDDVRDSRSIEVIRMLRGHGASIQAYDPRAYGNAVEELGYFGISYVDTMNEALIGADAVVILTEWPEFAELDLLHAKESMKGKVIFDGRNVLDQESVEDMGFTYYCVGKRTNAYEKEPDLVPGIFLPG